VDKSLNSTQQNKLQELLRQIRLEAGLRQTDLAERLGEPQSFVSKYESGERRVDFIELRYICKAIGITTKDFLNRFEASLDETERKVPKTTKALLGKRSHR
jgi:transcriptional regulator with XRE-family HTH domain